MLIWVVMTWKPVAHATEQKAHLSNQIDASDSQDTERTLAVKKHFMIYTSVVHHAVTSAPPTRPLGRDGEIALVTECGSPASNVLESSWGNRNDLRVTRNSCEGRPQTSCALHKLTYTLNVLAWSATGQSLVN